MHGIARPKSYILDNSGMDFEVNLKSILEWFWSDFEVHYGMDFEVTLKFIAEWTLKWLWRQFSKLLFVIRMEGGGDASHQYIFFRPQQAFLHKPCKAGYSQA